jgi:hypothetical protein
MDERGTFEERLTAALRAYVQGDAPAIDAAALAHAIAGGAPRGRSSGSRIRDAWRLDANWSLRIILIALVVLTLAGAVLVGVRLISPEPDRVDPDRGRFAPTGSLATGRERATATTLSDGRVLVVGGYDAELWDPDTGAFHPAGDLGHPRWQHTATLLPNGTVLVAGGIGTTTGMGSPLVYEAEVWDPADLTFTPAGASAGGHVGSQARLLADGRVLITGGTLVTASMDAAPEVWDPAARSFTDALGLPGVDEPAGVAIGDGTILRFEGGSASIWDPSSRAFRSAGAPVASRDGGATTTLLADGRVLVVGGRDPGTGQPMAEAEIWDPDTAAFSLAATPVDARAEHVAALLTDGRVLVAGGSGASARSAEVFETR